MVSVGTDGFDAEDQYRQFGPLRADPFEHFQSIHVRQVNIQYHRIEIELPEPVDGVMAVIRLIHGDVT